MKTGDPLMDAVEGSEKKNRRVLTLGAKVRTAS